MQTTVQLVGTESIKKSEFFVTFLIRSCILNTMCTIIIHDIVVVVYRNFEAGKQLITSTINGNDSLGWVDVLTRVDLRRKFQYFL